MKILFIHQNFPGQFRHLAPALVRQGHEVMALVPRTDLASDWEGVRLAGYRIPGVNRADTHPWLVDLETKTLRGEGLFLRALELRREGYTPDLVLAHPGWGESLFVRDVWPAARLAIYCEFFYQAEGGDVGFDPEFPQDDARAACRLRLKNANHLLHMEAAHAGLAPTRWQASTFPAHFRQKIEVVHDGIDTMRVAPDASVSLTLNERLRLTRDDDIITFVNRNLEPYRGYHIFMRALPAILAARPSARVFIVGGNDVSYGARAPEGSSWRQIFLDEVKEKLDLSRVHFLGRIPYDSFVRLLQISTVHVYLTYPFVLSWSLMEAMSAGCAIVASATQPVEEVLVDGENGYLFPFFDSQALAARVLELLADREQGQRLGMSARALMRQSYDLRSVCLPRQLAWVQSLV
ncbi:MAG: hypothetical protein RIQ52_2104 [Pseudomonadota bacterium]